MPDLLIDTNILVLQIIGMWDATLIPRHKRTAKFTMADFQLLQDHLRRYTQIKTTPAVLTEASNLMGNTFHQEIAAMFIAASTPLIEIVRPKSEVLAWEAFDRLGFADASVLAALDNETTVLTDDVQLYNQALYEGRDALNFHHLRRL